MSNQDQPYKACILAVYAMAILLFYVLDHPFETAGKKGTIFCKWAYSALAQILYQSANVASSRTIYLQTAPR
jgi:hypothetical protein